MAELPTSENLEKLCEEKGSDALVWYAWRNALRVLPVLGHMPIEKIWQQDVVRHVVGVSRVCLILAQWVSASKQTTADIYTYAAAAAYAADAADAADAANAAYAAANAANTAAYSTDITAYSYTAGYAADTANTASKAAAYTAAAADAASTVDYQFLWREAVFIPAWWYEYPLWNTKWFGLAGGEPKQIFQGRRAFDSQLRKLGLDFLADDLKDLWEGRPLGIHAKNYLKEFSDADLNDPVALRRLILEGEAAEHIHAVRVLLLGPGGAGKSSLADRLQRKPVEQGKKLTVGVDYLNHQPLNLYNTFDYLQQGGKKLDLYLWDFGGQTIFHGLHSAFLHENCVYVLVVDSRHEQAPDEWLHQIRHLAGGQAKVLLVTNWYEKCETRQNEARLLREFPDLLDEGSFFYFSCHEPDAPGFKDFVQALEKACLDSQRMVLKETLDVNEALQKEYQDNVFLESADLEDIIEQVTHRPESVETLPNKLEQLGFLVRVDSDDQHYCLKPAWAVDNAYAVLYSPLLREAKGVLQLKDLQHQFKGQIRNQHMRHLVEFLQMRSLCRKLASDDGYFFPDAAPADELPEASELLNNEATGLVIRFDLPYLPLGFHAALVYRLFVPGGISSTDDIWRQGFILRKGHSRAVVHYLTRKSVVELVLAGDWQDFAGLLNTVLVNLKPVLLEGKGIREAQIVPSVVLDQQVFSVHSAERLVDVLGQINSYGQLIREVKAMAGKINVNVGDGSQVAIDAHNVTQKYNSDNTTLEITADQRQQIATIIGSLLKNAGNLAPESLLAVAEVNKALAAPPDKPESRNLLGKVWNGLKETLSAVKTGTDIAEFALKHQAELATAITAAVTLLK
jgi:GTPase SAR1 family protein